MSWLSQFVDKKEAGLDWLWFAVLPCLVVVGGFCISEPFKVWALIGELEQMANGEEKGRDFYAVLGLDKECTDSELRNAYKKLAMVRIQIVKLYFLFLLYLRNPFSWVLLKSKKITTLCLDESTHLRK